MMRSQRSAPSLSPFRRDLLHHLARRRCCLITVKLDEEMCGAMNVRVRDRHANAHLAAGCAKENGRADTALTRQRRARWRASLFKVLKQLPFEDQREVHQLSLR
jgi:hypothetical protein